MQVTAVSTERRQRTAFGRIAVIARLAADSANAWPSKRYRENPVAFCREVLGVEPWAKQIEILEAVRDHKRVAVRSGHKVGKSHSAAMLALWFFCSFEDARVVLTSTTSRQVDTILWREIKKLISKAKVSINVEPPHELARSGLKAPDFREVVGFTAKEPEAVAGVSGANLLYLPDEASGVPDEIFEAIEGNAAAGARVAMFSNPTRTEGQFFRAFHKEAAFWKCIHVSSEDTPNAKEGREIIPGLAGREWIERNRALEGEKSSWFQVRVLGNFPILEEGRTLSLAQLEAAQNRWHEQDENVSGLLSVGLDPAGDGIDGDETSMTATRGMRQLAMQTMRGLTPPAIVEHTIGFLAKHARPLEIPRLVVDGDGEIGWDVYKELKAYLEKHSGAFELIRVRGGRKAVRDWQVYRFVRDEMWKQLVRWIENNGAILEDDKLFEELHAAMWVNVELMTAGGIVKRRTLTAKKELRQKLGRSPDRADSLMLSVWHGGASDEEVAALDAPSATSRVSASADLDDPPETTFDPYSALGAFGGS